MTDRTDDAEAIALEEALDALRRARFANLSRDDIAELRRAVTDASTALERKRPRRREDRSTTSTDA